MSPEPSQLQGALLQGAMAMVWSSRGEFLEGGEGVVLRPPAQSRLSQFMGTINS